MPKRTALKLRGRAVLRYIRPDGRHGWTRWLPNGVTTSGVNWLLEVGFRGGTQSSALYCGLISNAGFSAVDISDTHTSHAGWSEWTGILQATRPAWVPQPANGGLMGTLAASQFDITADGTIRGCFLSTIDVLGSVAAGTLYNTVAAVAGLPVEIGGTLSVRPSVRIGAA